MGKSKRRKPAKAGNDEWPYLQAAFFCERVLEERADGQTAPDMGGVHTAIRIVDHLRLPPDLPLPEMGTKIGIPLAMVVSFKAGEALGDRELSVTVTPPGGGVTRKVFDMHVRFRGGEIGAFIQSPATPVWFEGLGLYWYTVRLRGASRTRLYTKMPLRLSLQQPKDEKAVAKDAAKKGSR